MLLSDLMESTSTPLSALDQLIYNANKMYVLYADTLTYNIKDMYAKGDHEDMYRTVRFQMGRYKGKWFVDNYLSTGQRGTKTVTGLKNALNILSKDPRYNVEGLSGLAHFELNMSSQKQADVAGSSSSYVTQLEILPMIMLKLATKAPEEFRDRLKTSATKLRHAIETFYSTWEKLHEDWKYKWGGGKEAKDAQDKQNAIQQNKKEVVGGQNSSVEGIVNNVLASIDKKAAAEIRPIIARSDNKLLVLQQELQKRGIKM